jgi:hypothetical protein
MNQISFKYENNNEIKGYLLTESAPKFCKKFLDNLPMETVAFHTRWSGRQNTLPLIWKENPAMENQTAFVGLGDIVYFREWENLYDNRGIQGLVLCYGSEHLLDERGEIKVNLVGKIFPEYWDELKLIGARVWQKGEEKVTIILV